MDQTKTGKLIRSLRLEKGMTQLELAVSIGVSDKAVSKWERGDGTPDVFVLKQIADLYGVTVDFLDTASGPVLVPGAEGGGA